MFMDLNFGVLDFDQKFKIFDFFFQHPSVNLF